MWGRYAALGVGAGSACGTFLVANVWGKEGGKRRRSQPVKAVVIGGGCSGAMTAQAIEHLTDCTLIDRKSYFEFTPSLSELLLGQRVEEEEVQTNTTLKDWVRGRFFAHRFYLHHARIEVGEVVEVAPKHVVLKDGKVIPFDLAFICLGASYSAPWRGSAASTVADRVAEAARFTQTIDRCKSIAVLGGGPAGVEHAARLAEEHPEKKVTLIHSRQVLLPKHQTKVGRYASWRLWWKGVDVRVLRRAKEVRYDPAAKEFVVKMSPTNREGKVILDKDEELRADYVLDCRGGSPNTAALKRHFSANLDDKGYIMVNRHSQLQGHPHIFALGDCARYPGAMGDMSGLAYITDQVYGVGQALDAIFKGSPLGRGNELFSRNYPMQTLRLGPHDYCGTVQLTGGVRGPLAWIMSRKMHSSFLDPLAHPTFSPFSVKPLAMACTFEWLEKAKTSPDDYAYFRDM